MKGLLLAMFSVVLTCAAQAQPLNADAGPDVTICSNGQATLNGSASGGQAPYEYSWSPATGLSDPNIANPVCTVNSNTAYTLTVTDSNGNADTDQVNILVANVTTGGAFINSNTTICAGESIALSWSNFSNNAPGTTYIVDWGDGTIDPFFHPPPASITHTYSISSCAQAGGEFTVNWLISNPCDTRTGQFNQIRVSEQPQAAFSLSQDTVCVNTAIVMTDQSAGAQAPQCATPNHVWTISPGTFTVASGSLGSINGSPNTPGLWTSGSQTLQVQFTAPGTYTITDVVGNNICGRDTLIRTICVEAPPVPNFSLSPTTGCSPLVVNTTNNSISNSCDLTRTWQATQVTQGCPPQPGSVNINTPQSATPTFTFTGAGTYQVTLTLENSCGAVQQTVQPITVNAPPIVDLATLPTICAGQATVSPTATVQNCNAPITAYAWSFQGGSPASSTQQVPGQVAYSTPGSYTITASATNACGTGSDQGTLIVSTFLAVNVGADVIICGGSSTPLSGSVTSGGTLPYTYSWSPATGLSAANVSNPTASPTQTTTYTLTVTDAGGCVGTDQVTVTVNAPATAEAGGPYFSCGTNAVNVQATTNNAGTWTSSGGGTFADASNPETSYTPDPSEVGSTITLTWETFDPDATGPCSGADDTADLIISTPATAVPGGPYAICSSDIATIAVTTTPGVGLWSGGQGVFGDPTDATTTYDPGAAEAGTTVFLTWTTIDPDGPAAPCPQVSATVEVNVLEAATAEANGPYATCGTNAVDINATTNGTGQWSSSGIGTFADASNPETSYTPDPSEVGSTIILTWGTFDPDGTGPCPGASSAELLVVFTIPDPQITQDGTTLVSSAGQSYQWLLNGQPIAGATGPTWDPLVPGTYAVAVTDANGCTGASQPYDVFTVAITEQEQERSLVVWPVPCTDVLYVAIPPQAGVNAVLELFDGQGRLVFRERPAASTAAIDLANRPSGIHFLRLVDGHMRWATTVEVL